MSPTPERTSTGVLPKISRRQFTFMASIFLTPLERKSFSRKGRGLAAMSVTKEDMKNFADHWIAAWNFHDLDQIISHYEDAIELTSPVAAQLLGLPDGKVIGKANLRAYFQRGLEAFPDLRFELQNVLCGLNSVVLYYKNQRGTRSGEYMEFSTTGKVIRVVAHYSA
jgi:hypothetical protein